MASKTPKKDNTPKKTSTTPRNTARHHVSASGKTPEEIRQDRIRTTMFLFGFFLACLTIFLFMSFISYMMTGQADFDRMENPSAADMANENGTRFANSCGSLGAMTAYFFINNLFGLASFVLLPYMLMCSLMLMRVWVFRNMVRKGVMTALLTIWTSVFLATLCGMDSLQFLNSTFINFGGRHGQTVASTLHSYIGPGGQWLLLLSFAVSYLVYVSARTIEHIRNLFRLRAIRKATERAQEWMKNRKNNVNDNDSNVESDDDVDGEVPSATIEQTEQNEAPAEPVVEEESSAVTLTFTETSAAEEKQNEGEGKDEAATSAPNKIDNDLALELAALNQHTQDLVDENAEFIKDGSDEEESKEAEFSIDIPETEKGSGEIVREPDLSTPYNPKDDLSMYKYPPLTLLRKMDDSSPSIDMSEQTANKERIIHVLKNFGVEIQSIKATIGPTITLYEIVPAEGTRISKIRNLEDDIALSLAAEGIRIIAPIPGKGTIGIEVPNKKKCMVPMESIINSRAYQETKMDLPCALGKTISNEVFMFDLAKAPHLLVAGATGQGKSVGLNAIVTSLLYKKHPAELKIVMVDPKKVEFSIYSPIENHFLARLEEEEDCIITDVQKVVKTLNSLCVLMDTRYDLLKKAGVRNIKEYNEKFMSRHLNPNNGHEYMPYVVVIVDEFGDLIMTAGKEVELPICRIAQLARAVGIHMIIATQRPQASIISGAIKTNFPTRIAFKVSSMMDSRVILDRPGAQQLIGKGDLLYLQGAEPVRVQCAFVDTPEVNDICQYISKQQSYFHPMYLPEVDDPDASSGADSVDVGHLDPMFVEVAKFVVSNQQGSTSLIQRNYSIGYNRAGRIMDQLEKMGVVGPQVGAKPREVLIKDPMTLESLFNTIR